MIQIQPLGKVDEELIKWLAEELEKKFATIVKILPPKEIPKACFDNTRRQFNSTCILFSYKSEEITLLVTSEDI
ncbi:MAG: hypothetical protein QXW59_04450, partial [Archaeoglobaceae archaeon]